MSKSWPTIRKQPRGDFIIDMGTVFGKRLCATRQTLPEANDVATFYRAEKKRLGQLAGKVTPKEMLECMRCKELLNGRSLTDAVEFYIQHNKMIVDSHTVNETIAALLDQQEKKNRRPRTISTTKNRLEKFSSWFGKNGGDVALFSADRIQEWLDFMKFSPATEVAYLRELNSMFNFAVKKGWREANPVLKIEKPIVERKSNGILKVDDVKRLLDMAKGYHGIGGWMAMQLFGGLRPSEADQIAWSDITANGIHVKPSVAKTHQERYVPISENLEAWLYRYPSPKAGLDNPFLAIQIRRDICKTYGIEWHHDCLRKSFCSYHLAMHDKPELTASLMGHVRGIALMYKHYRVPVTKEEAKKYWEINP